VIDRSGQRQVGQEEAKAARHLNSPDALRAGCCGVIPFDQAPPSIFQRPDRPNPIAQRLAAEERGAAGKEGRE